MNIEQCNKCESELEFITNVDNGDNTGQDEYFCKECSCYIVYTYKKQFDKPTRWEV